MKLTCELTIGEPRTTSQARLLLSYSDTKQLPGMKIWRTCLSHCWLSTIGWWKLTTRNPLMSMMGLEPKQLAIPWMMLLKAYLWDRQAQFEHILEVWRAKKNIVLQGAPGVGKSFAATASLCANGPPR